VGAVATEQALAATLRTRLGPRPSRFAAAAVTLDNIALAVDGIAPEADFEIGSISKGITGLLYADSCARGEIRPDTTLGELLQLGGCAVAGLKLQDVSRHASGLPRLAPELPGASSR
jgi:CubicO group peptidase (beta-lactamase class C family)